MVLVVIMFACVLGAGKVAFAGIYIQPYLQNPQPDGITILWWTDDSERNCRVQYWRGQFENDAIASNEYIPSMDKWVHESKLTNLSEETQYQYKVVSGKHSSKTYTFNTSKRRDSNFHFAVLGDGRTDNDTIIDRHRKIARMAVSFGADIIFEVGDMVENGEAEHWGRFYRRVITASDTNDPGSNLASKIPYHTIVGNHEIYLDKTGYPGGNLNTAMARYKALVANPKNGSANSSWEERYYAIKYGCATFIVLDNNNDLSTTGYDNHDRLGDNDTPPWSPGNEQYKWMVKQLQDAQKNSVFTFVLFHPSPYSRGVHGDPCDAQRGIEIRVLDPIFRQYGVDAVFTSHDHFVEHCLTGPVGFEKEMNIADANNLNWLVMGNSGHTSRAQAPGWEEWMDILGNDAPPYYTVYFYDWAGDHTLCSFYDVDIIHRGKGFWQATFQVVRSDGKIFDTFSIDRKDPLRKKQSTPPTKLFGRTDNNYRLLMVGVVLVSVSAFAVIFIIKRMMLEKRG